MGGTKKKSQVWISAILYILIAAIAMVIILQVGIPLLNKMKDRTTFERSKNVLSALDQQITEVASEGQGSQRVIAIEIREGNIIVDDSDNKLKWQLETKTEVIEPRTSLEIGNLKIYSNIEVDTSESKDEYNVSNSRIRVIFDRFEDGSIDIDNIIKNLFYIDQETLEEKKVAGNFNFNLCSEDAKTGEGFAEMSPPGNNTNIGSAKVIVHMIDSDTSAGCGKSYDIEFVLDSEADFIKTRIVNLDKR